MLEAIIAGFGIGIIGSLHCIGMCGPIALSLPYASAGNPAKAGLQILYNGGRIVSYSILGLVAGLVGSQFNVFGLQQWFSISMGTLILLYIYFKYYYKGSLPHFRRFEFWIVSKLQALLQSNPDKSNGLLLYRNYVLIGILNGLLPCGLVYMAIAGSMVSGSSISGGLFMIAFGLGTFPVMFSIGVFRGYLTVTARQKIRSWIPISLIAISILLFARGANLGIPYVSPKYNAETHQPDQCCKKR